MIDTLVVRPMLVEDWPAVRRIYADGIATGLATFEAEPPDWDHFDAQKLEFGRLVATDGGGMIMGWTAMSPTSTRPVYRGVVEHSIYVADHARGAGIGRRLLAEMIKDAEQAGVWTIQSSIFEENVASLRLHAALGFRTVGRRERIGRMSYGPWAGQWRDTILIERRSKRDPADERYRGTTE